MNYINAFLHSTHGDLLVHSLLQLGEHGLVRVLWVVLLVDIVVRVEALRLVAHSLRRVRLGQILKLLELLVGKVDRLQVGVNPGSCDRLGQSDDPSLDQPRDKNGSTVDRVLVGNSLDGLVLSQVGTVGSAQRRVGAGKDVVFLQVCNELGLRALDGEFDLVGNGLDPDTAVQELVGSVNVEVGDTNGLGQALVNELLHLLPRRGDIVGELNVELVLAVLAFDSVVKGWDNTLGGVNLEVDVPVHEVQVEVLQAEVLQGVLDGELDVFGVVVQLKELGSDENLLSGDTGLLDTLTDFGLVPVSPGAVDVPVAVLEGVLNGLCDLTLGRLPSTETDRRDLLPAGEFERCLRHFV